MKCHYKLYNTDETVIEFQLDFATMYGSNINYNNKRYLIIAANTTADGDWIIKGEEVVLGSVSQAFRNRFKKFLKNNDIVVDTDAMSEEMATSIFIKFFEKDFFIEKNVSGKHFSGKRQNLDLVLIPKDTSSLKNKNLVFGIEMKNPFLERSKGRKNSRINNLVKRLWFWKFIKKLINETENWKQSLQNKPITLIKRIKRNRLNFQSVFL